MRSLNLPDRRIILEGGQRTYVNTVYNNDITFALGPAGTGKTFLAVACALSYLENKCVDKIVLVRPAVEAGEKLGFLPGDMSEKVSPYLAPLYDALSECSNKSSRREVEILPLAFMRGRTFKNTFVVCDEAQNSTKIQMKMLLTRLGLNSKMIIVGDVTQIDLQNHRDSGLQDAIDRLHNLEGIGVCELTTADNKRHPLIEKVIHAYED